MTTRPSNPGGASRVRRRALLGAAVLVVLVALAGLAAYLTRDGRGSPAALSMDSASSSAPPSVSAPSASASTTGSPTPDPGSSVLPVPPDTHDPVVFGKAAAEALWSYDTRASSQRELLTALHGWLTGESTYADQASVDALVPSPLLWKQMAANGQFATATVNEGHFPESFSRALQEDPGAITQTYVYAVTISGKQSIAWNGSPAGGAESRSITLAVQCRPSRSCALAGVLPAVAP
ncbi:hypothetical protein ACFV97_25505 [Streptomyces sp. NPDC059913]|uniref:hypothetical protein n=1 Tax=unclassified Streptomyces TaxID=2593676 RepID=UPI003657F0FD